MTPSRRETISTIGRLLSTATDAVLALLGEARQLGFLGPGRVEDHLVHTKGFVGAVPAPLGMVLDLGSGGGVPGLILAALHWTDACWVLLEANHRRVEFLREAVARLGLNDRVGVLQYRTEVAGREGSLRHQFDLVVARSFGSPAVTAESASPFLLQGGHLLVSEPPRPVEGRWPAAGLAALGLRLADRAGPGVQRGATAGAETDAASIQILDQVTPCPSRFPRRVGIPAKRPLW